MVYLLLLSGASLVLPASFAIGADDSAPAARRSEARQEAKPLAFPAGFTTKTGSVDEGIRSGLAKLADRALTKGDFNSMLAELSRPDRERAREFKGADQAKLDAQIDRIRSAWKTKYGKEFAIEDKAAYGAPVQIIEGEVADPAMALSSWPVPAMADQPITASAVTSGDSKSIRKEARQEKLEKGRSVALVRLPGVGAKPDLTVSMIHHLPAFWRIDIPDTRTGEQIYNDLLTQLTWIGDHSDKWPADANDAGRAVTYHVAAALYGIDVSAERKG
jgi:hypothetical protein